ncbi:MAG: pyridoxamine 5'-phosphate oxidase family protein [Promethearchaeota archaeon]|nr:MAG: pyridoxamine 5'-phosphate oxidase family protein [Candidatus Lokiarchaeota archaeon]
MKIIKLPQMTEIEINKALESHNICRIAFIDGEYPYISPFQYLYLNNTIYFHFTDYGKKKEILKKNRNVCVSIEKLADDLSKYFFISIQGKLNSIENPEERKQVITKMVQEAKKKYSKNFLSAHGFEKKGGWDTFTDKNQLIYKLDDVISRIGLKSI